MLYIDSSRAGGEICSHMSHSCEPNCALSPAVIDGHHVIAIRSIRDISPGEELTQDYNCVTESTEEFKVRHLSSSFFLDTGGRLSFCCCCRKKQQQTNKQTDTTGCMLASTNTHTHTQAALCLCGSRHCRGSFLYCTGVADNLRVLQRWHRPLHRLALLLRASSSSSSTLTEEDDDDDRDDGDGDAAAKTIEEGGAAAGVSEGEGGDGYGKNQHGHGQEQPAKAEEQEHQPLGGGGCVEEKTIDDDDDCEHRNDDAGEINRFFELYQRPLYFQKKIKGLPPVPLSVLPIHRSVHASSQPAICLKVVFFS